MFKSCNIQNTIMSFKKLSFLPTLCLLHTDKFHTMLMQHWQKDRKITGGHTNLRRMDQALAWGHDKVPVVADNG